MSVKPVSFGAVHLNNAAMAPQGAVAVRTRFAGDTPDEYESQSRCNDAPVNVWAKQFETGRPIAGATLTDLATGDRWETGEDGYARFSVAPGRVLTLVINKPGFPQLQSASVAVPPEGLTDENHEITLQVAGNPLYKLLKMGMGKPESGKHHVILTVSEAGKNLHNDDGEAGATVTLRAVDGSERYESPVYLGKIFGKTEWIRPILCSRIPFLKRFAHQATTGDGGVVFKNVSPVFKDGQPAEYILEANKTGPDGKPVSFSTARVMIFPDSPEVINVSPPLGPRVTSETND